MNQFPLYDDYLRLLAEFDAANVAITGTVLFVVVWILIAYLRFPRLMPAVRTVLSYSFFVVALIALVSNL